MKALDATATKLVLDHLQLVPQVIASYSKRRGASAKNSDWDDLHQSLCLRLMACASRYQPVANVPFRAYVWSQLQHEINDHFRIEAKRGFNGTRGKEYKALSLSQALADSPEAIEDSVTDPAAQDAERYRRRAEVIRVGVAKLPAKLGFVIRALYLESWRLPDIASALGVCLSSIDRYRLNALELLAANPDLREAH